MWTCKGSTESKPIEFSDPNSLEDFKALSACLRMLKFEDEGGKRSLTLQKSYACSLKLVDKFTLFIGKNQVNGSSKIR